MNRAIACGVALLATGASAALAQGLDLSKGGPIEVTSRDGIEWRQNEQVVIARGDARAVRADNQVMGDTLTAHYRKKAGVTAASAPGAAGPAAAGDTGANEIYRLDAEGHVKIFNPSDIATGDRAVYDMDQAVLVLTGKDLMLTTPNQVMTARDTMEYWSQKRMAVGRGLATVTTSDGRRLSADVLVGYTAPDDGIRTQQRAASGPGPQPAAASGKDPLGTGGKLQRVEGFGHVEVRTATETITGERAVYVADTGIARIVGNVAINRGLNHAVGDEALVNMKTGVSRLLRTPGSRVEGVILPGETGTTAAPGAAPKPAAPKR